MHDNRDVITERWKEYIESSWIQELDGTSFLSRCNAGTVSKEELNRFLVQQYFYARQFTRYLCALLSNIQDENDRRELTENLVDETGLGVQKGVPHSVIYREMLNRMGIEPSSTLMAEATKTLIDTMLESCRSTNAAIGLGALCLGAEAIVPHVYSQIVKGFEAHGYTKKDLDFFYIHIGCDDEHALTMKKIIDRQMQDPRQLLMLKASARRIIHARARFFESLGDKKKELAYESAV